MIDLILRDGRLVLPDGSVVRGDLGVDDGVIVALGEVAEAARGDFDCGGRPVLPGGVDVHVHFRTPGYSHKETWETASRSAVVGGITSVVDMPNTDPVTVDHASLVAKAAQISGDARCHYGFFVGAAPDNLDALRWLEEADTPYCGVKVFMGSSTGRLLVDDPAALEGIFRDTRRIIAVHAEDDALLEVTKAAYSDAREHHLARPTEAAVRAVRAVLALSAAYDHDAHICHLSTREELALLRHDPGHRTGRVSAEVCPHHLAFTHARTETHGNYAKMNPPLRTEADRRALWQALRDGDLLCVSTDHAPHLAAEKDRPYAAAPSGVPGVETSLRYLLAAGPGEGLSLPAVARLMATEAAARFALRGKGRLAVGHDADLVVLADGEPAPYRRDEVLSRCGWSPFEGELLAPAPEAVFVLGRLAARRGRMVDDGVRGRPLAFGP
jgi:dihydroorotase